MLRFAILAAAGVAFLAFITGDFASTFITAGGQSSAPARPAPPKAEVALASPAASADAQTEIAADAGGQYAAEVQINGQIVGMLVDTGATMVDISYDTAARLGMAPAASDYTGRVRTANGVAAVAPVTLREVTVGPVYVGEVKALVADRSAGAINLLGMSFLKRLASVEQRDGKLVLRQ
ncbi:MAG: TIGR02281 family clan AA aspartic protease [Roseiarcus sp.]